MHVQKAISHEYCTICGELTGGAGRDEDSNYVDKYGENELGPLCDECYHYLIKGEWGKKHEGD